MKNFFKTLFTLLVLVTMPTFAQAQNVAISGKVIEKATNQPLEFASVIVVNTNDTSISDGMMTNEKGEFSLNVKPGNYDIKIEFLGYKTVNFSNRAVTQNLNLGAIAVTEDTQLLDEVVVTVEKPLVEIKLDKKVYNVADDKTIKGGTASDVLDNVPSLAVDQDGNVSLRGNENVKILIDGKPSGISGNIADILKTLPADVVGKVEVITNPSARYEAEGGAGIVNIVLKKGKGQGINGSVSVTAGTPDNYRANANVNFKGEKYNFFTNLGYNNSKSPGNSKSNGTYLDQFGDVAYYMDEKRDNERVRKGHNVNFGLDLYITPSITWTNTVGFRDQRGDNTFDVDYLNYDINKNLNYSRNRFSTERDENMNFEYSTRFEKNFAKDGHKLIVDGNVSTSRDDENSVVTDLTEGNVNKLLNERTKNFETQNRMIGSVDYVLPIGENAQFEAGYRGSYTDLVTDFGVEALNNGIWEPNQMYNNIFQYKEKIHAFYTQYGSKINKFSYLLGLRWEDSKINVNELLSQDFNTKKYNDFFPSAFLAYELNEKSNVSVSYSRRINRPRGRMLNPFSNYSSNINLFQGNPDLDPSKTNAFDLGYMTKFGSKVTFNTSAYFNHTENAYQFVSRESGAFVDGIPVILSSPINLATEYRYGVEFNVGYNPYKWWRLNANLNIFRSESKGDYTYINFQNQVITQNFDNETFAANARLTSKVTLPYKIDWQTNISYRAPETRAQGKVKSETGVNMALSKDILKDKATIALNVQDLFNSRKRRMETNLPTVITSSEMQWRERQINLTFTYRFNKSKNERDRFRNDEMGEDMMGM
nr:TonB-dependent receptor [uncultured Flavobacterium sp.]